MNANVATRVITLTTKPGKIDDAIAEASEFANLVKDIEPDCLVYSVSKSKPLMGDGPEQIVIAIVFKDEAAMKAHEQTPHAKARMEAKNGEEFLAGPPDVRAVVHVGGFTMRE
ncbi:Antibiotic biosynthesis monooxygenase protein [Rutstroemia sp. NJR-2017a WRK4]|nr:Antibiotic biosynthesis monooxygenase protein [Rutstroemia sp. NJR-2017a WRK4]